MSQVQVAHAAPASHQPQSSSSPTTRGPVVVTSGYTPTPQPAPPPPPHRRRVGRRPRLRDLLPPGVRPAHPWLKLAALFLELFLIVVTVGIGWMLWAVMIAGTGQTPAKRLLHMRVIGANTFRPVGLIRLFMMRFLLGTIVAVIAFAASAFILVAMPIWDRRRQNVWDKVSNTYVVVDHYDAWHTKPG